MNNIQYIKTAGGEELAVLPRDLLEDFQDSAQHIKGMEAHGESLTAEEMRALLVASTPLAFWRHKRGLTQSALAEMAQTTQPHIGDLESGRRGGSFKLMARIAQSLNVDIEALLDENA